MSIPLPQVNLAAVSVGQTGTISLANVGISAGGVSSDPSLIKGAGTLHIFNESGSGLLLQFLTSGDGFFLPAGGWIDRPIRSGEQGLKWTVLYNLPSPPVTLLLVTYYAPNESIPRTPTLGNSPIGIGGTVNTSNVQTLSNENNASPVLVIDIGQSGHTQLITINSDGSAIWLVLQSGTAHQVLKIESSGNPLQLGQANDTTEALGNFLVDGTLSNANGVVTGIQFLTSAVQINVNATLNNGSTNTSIDVYGQGTPAIPSTATAVLLSCDWTGAAAGAYIQAGPQGYTTSAASDHPLLGQAQGGNNKVATSGIVQLNTANGKFDVKAPNGQINGFSCFVWGYFA